MSAHIASQLRTAFTGIFFCLAEKNVFDAVRQVHLLANGSPVRDTTYLRRSGLEKMHFLALLVLFEGIYSP